MSLTTFSLPTGQYATPLVVATNHDQAVRKAKSLAREEGYKVLDVTSAIEQFEDRWRVELKVEPQT